MHALHFPRSVNRVAEVRVLGEARRQDRLTRTEEQHLVKRIIFAVMGLMALAATLVITPQASAATDATTFQTCSTNTVRGYGCVTWYLSTNAAGRQVVRPHICTFHRSVSDLQTVYYEAYGAIGHGANETSDGVYPTGSTSGTVTWDCGYVFRSWAYRSPGAWFEMAVTGYPGGHTGQETYWVYSSS
jgi:hypothetical protein